MTKTSPKRLSQMNEWRKNHPIVNRASVRKWQRNNPEKVQSIIEAFHVKNPEKKKAYYKTSYEKNKAKILEGARQRRLTQTPEDIQKEYRRRKALYRERRSLVLTHYGGGTLACVRCGYNTFDALDLDHINNDGAKDRPKYGASWASLFRHIIRDNFPPGYQTLCRNCNWLKHVEHSKTKSIS